MAGSTWRTLDGVPVQGKRVLLRADLNVPMRDGQLGDLTRLERLTPTIRELADAGARVVVASHFARPNGQRVPEMSLRPVADALAGVLGHPVAFAEDCVGEVAAAAVERLRDGDVLVLENTRFHPGEEANDSALAEALALHADLYVNDAFSAAHRAHASTEAVARLLPAHVGRLMQAELEALDAALTDPERPAAAVIGGAKVSTKLELIGNVSRRVDLLVIGGAMANTFLAAQGLPMGRSLQEPDMHATALDMLAMAKDAGCEVLLPLDLVVAREFKAGTPSEVVPAGAVPGDAMALDIGPRTVRSIMERLPGIRTLVWNGPLGAFEIPPFDHATNLLACAVADATAAGRLLSVAGGGDTVAALRHAGVMDEFSYVSTAGGAFLEWLEGKTLPGVQVLRDIGRAVGFGA
jgi:phosphoglycerate kinase